ncbi:MAG: insulinase family protein [Bacteroidales bacterium]|nr:insulinase family protein [Bacteroidales bacterium]
MSRIFYITITLLLLLTAPLAAQDISNVLQCIENSQVITLPNGFRIQLVTTSQYRYCNVRLSADVSALPESPRKGIKQVVAAMTGSTLAANQVMIKNMISHDKALDSLLNFMHEVMYGNNPTYVNFDDYKKKRIQYLKEHGNPLDYIASDIIGQPYITADDLSKINKSDYMDFRQKCFAPDKCLITIVADADMEFVKPLVEKYFANAPRSGDKVKPEPLDIKPQDFVYALEEDSTASGFEAAFMDYYPCDKTPKNYVVNDLVYHILYDSLARSIDRISSFKYDVNTLNMDGSNNDFPQFATQLFERRSEDYDVSTSLQSAKERLSKAFRQGLQHPDYAAEIASNIVLYNFPKNYFTNYENTINAVTAAEAQQHLKNIIQNGSCVFVVKGSHRSLFCTLNRIAKDRQIDFMDSKKNLVARIPKGFGAYTILNAYVEATGLNNPPKNMSVNLQSLYTLEDGMQYKAFGRVLRKSPNMYRMDNNIRRDDTISLFHFKEVYDGAIGADSTMIYGFTEPDSARAIVLRQKASFPQEAHYDELGIRYKHYCDYDLFKKGYYRIDVTDALGKHYSDYYSAESGLKSKSVSYDKDGKAVKEITFEYERLAKYVMPVKVVETSSEARIDITLTDYDFSTQHKKTDFTIILDTGKMKKNKKN